MRLALSALAATLLLSTPVLAAEGEPASPSGAPAAAAEHGSSMAGAPAAKNEMKSHEENMAKQKTMDDPHKTSH